MAVASSRTAVAAAAISATAMGKNGRSSGKDRDKSNQFIVLCGINNDQ